MAASNPILIIGAGISGLALAQALRQADLPFKIFEGDLSTEFRAQGYRIRINKAGGTALQACLSPELWQKFQDSCGLPPKNNARLDAVTTATSPMGFGPPKGPGSIPTGPQQAWDSCTADRSVLRNLLLEGLEDRIFFGHKLNKFDISDDKVTAYFENDSLVDGSLLVAADGASSIVRRQHLPSHQLLDTGIRCIYGKTAFTTQLTQKYAPAGDHGAVLIVDQSSKIGNNNLALFGETIKFKNNALRTQLPDDYVYWVLVGDQRFFATSDAAFLGLRGAEAVALSAEVTQHWHESIQSLLALQDPARAAALRVSVASPEMHSWEASSKITFVGDAIHVMPPTGGIGANTALQDSAALAGILREAGLSVSSIARYEAEMRVRAAEAIMQSLQGGKHMLGLGDWTEFKTLQL